MYHRGHAIQQPCVTPLMNHTPPLSHIIHYQWVMSYTTTEPHTTTESCHTPPLSHVIHHHWVMPYTNTESCHTLPLSHWLASPNYLKLEWWARSKLQIDSNAVISKRYGLDLLSASMVMSESPLTRFSNSCQVSRDNTACGTISSRPCLMACTYTKTEREKRKDEVFMYFKNPPPLPV